MRIPSNMGRDLSKSLRHVQVHHRCDRSDHQVLKPTPDSTIALGLDQRGKRALEASFDRSADGAAAPNGALDVDASGTA
jgi:hypothetical protein